MVMKNTSPDCQTITHEEPGTGGHQFNGSHDPVTVGFYAADIRCMGGPDIIAADKQVYFFIRIELLGKTCGCHKKNAEGVKDVSFHFSISFYVCVYQPSWSVVGYKDYLTWKGSWLLHLASPIFTFSGNFRTL